jgi:Flp pilus assembly protein TadD
MRSLLLLSAALLATSCLPHSPPSQVAIGHNDACTLALKSGDCQSATAHCDHALEFSPDYPEALVNKGLIAMQCGHDAKAARGFFVKALRLDQESAQAYNNLGALDLEDGDTGAAEERFRRALKVNPDYHEARFNLAKTYIAQKKPEEAERHLRQLLAVDASNADAQNLLGVLRLQAKDLTEAISRFDAAVLLVPDHPGYHFNRGVAYAQAGRLEEAKDEFRACLSTQPDSVDCRHNLDVLLKGQ